jgi:spore germination cell wall hydrolase CwlJ-like protein
MVLSAGLLLVATSCVHDSDGAGQPYLAASAPVTAGPQSALAVARLADAAASPEEALSGDAALAANAALPITGAGDFGAAPLFASGTTPLDQSRSLECLAQAIYYEARSESGDGQRAVAQVVLNRVRHPAYPSSVCGVVYQGPMRAGGGCQFSFTCDGSLAIAPAGAAWLAARRIAMAALAGSVYAAVGHATHYHTLAVFPRWAPRLIKSTLIGNHIFYRLPGALGAPGAFTSVYAGREPEPTPSRTLRPQLKIQLASLLLPGSNAEADPASAVIAPSDSLPGVRMTERGLPESRVRDAYLNAGRLRAPDEAAASSEQVQP